MRTRRRHSALLFTALGSLLAVSLGASPAVPAQLRTGTQAAAEGETTASAPGANDAQRLAEKTGEAVEVESLRDEYATTYANPDGTFTANQYVQPVRVRKDGKWTGIDTTLARGKNGLWAPKAALTNMSFSSGGDGPFARIEKDGRELTLDWPGALPEPHAEGSSLLYPDVLDGVDLKVTAEQDGFSHLLVVKTAEAAAQPELATLTLPLNGEGVSVEETADGGMAARDETTGGTVFEAAQPLMWDSSGNSVQEAKRSISGAETSDSEATGPTEGAKVADVGLDVSGGELKLTPDTALLQGDETVYPVYVDPVTKTANRSSWAMVSSHWSSSEFWKFKDDEGVGRCPADVSYQCASSDDRKRQFFAIPTATFEDKKIVKAEFAVTMVHTYSDSARSVVLSRVNSSGGSAINSGTNWGNQPSPKETIGSQSPTNPAGSCTSTNQNVRFTVTDTVQKAADSGWDTTTFRLAAGEEADYSYWKRFCGNAHLEVTYNRPPLQPDMRDLTMSPGGSCEYGKADEHYVSEAPMLNSAIKDYDHGDLGSNTEKVQAEYHVFWTQNGTTQNKYATMPAQSTKDATASGQTGVATFKYKAGSDVSGDGEAGFTLPQNVTIGWEVRGYDGKHWGPWSSGGSATRCEFIYDSTVPKAPVITSKEYPDDDVWHAGVGDYGSFTIDSPSADVTAYKYRFLGSSAWSTATPSSPGGAVTVRWMPPAEGPASVEAKAVDGAGNAQKTAMSYTFLVADGRAPVASWALGDAAGATSAAGTSGAPDAKAGAGVTFGSEGPHKGADKAAAFDGSENAYLDAGKPVIDTARSFSVAAWVRADKAPTDNVTVLSQDGTGEAGFELGYDVDTKSWTFRAPLTDVRTMGTWKVSGGRVTLGEWMHLIATYDEVTGKMVLYVDGQRVNDDVEDRRTKWSATGPLQIGRKLALDGYTNNFKGGIADVNVFDRVVTASEGQALSDVPSVQRAYWMLDSAADGSSPEAYGGKPLTLGGSAQIYLPDESCDASMDPDCPPPPPEPLAGDGDLKLDGVSGYASMASDSGTQEPFLTKQGSFTLALRARLATVTSGKDLTALSLAGKAEGAVQVVYDAADDRWKLRATAEDGTAAKVTTLTSQAGAPSSEGNGDHLAVVYAAAFGDLLLYVNGDLVARTAWDNSWDFSTTSVQVGRSLTGTAGSSYFAGSLDEVRVFQGALDPATLPTVAVLPSGESIEGTYQAPEGSA
ncbi:LamG-like jellyroll fold domain-containing protein [Streptomyces evansiae]|uniref:LamG-like jellyroll fold domain-containing protein n=1 Tax=Streptomyces evansiae TaxID=3075535 RepID=UPI002883A0D8|nr:LamG-like jellyroll fold domain-containing protein [Streptomyces sp. DSM 41859]MDT0420293.1 LamG-like jellyroll fold domain-containing protein [Streptomyces sp. DSM 41859]